MSHSAQILDHLTKGPITAMDALNNYRECYFQYSGHLIIVVKKVLAVR